MSEVVKQDITYVQIARDIIQDLIREISSSINSLGGGRIPVYQVSLDFVEQILRSATTTVVQSSQIHLAYSLSSAIPMYLNPQNLKIRFILNLPII